MCFGKGASGCSNWKHCFAESRPLAANASLPSVIASNQECAAPIQSPKTPCLGSAPPPVPRDRFFRRRLLGPFWVCLMRCGQLSQCPRVCSFFCPLSLSIFQFSHRTRRASGGNVPPFLHCIRCALSILPSFQLRALNQSPMLGTGSCLAIVGEGCRNATVEGGLNLLQTGVPPRRDKEAIGSEGTAMPVLLLVLFIPRRNVREFQPYEAILVPWCYCMFLSGSTPLEATQVQQTVTHLDSPGQLFAVKAYPSETKVGNNTG